MPARNAIVVADFVRIRVVYRVEKKLADSGHTFEAIEHLRDLLASPVGQECCIQRLKIDPVWDPIRNDPGFQQLLAGKELVGPNE